ncbi:MAG: hypothetical protein JW864_10965 [Spirochaetes bacterium]|nr:hypothetical protein [Spirochaetota bacterium]
MDNNIIYNNLKTQNTGFQNTEKTQPRKFTGNENLDKDAFLKLLVTELRHQDPTQPMENREFISQMAQFSALEQMTNVNKSVQTLNRSSRSGEAYSLLGKQIKAFDPVTGRKIEGLVSGMFFKGDDIRLVVGGKEIGLNDVHAVYTVNTAWNPGNAAAMYEENAESNLNNNTSKEIKNYNDIKIIENK